MKLAMLGTNGFQPTDDGQTACFMIPELGIVLDAGSGLYRISNYLQTQSLDIYLTHAHSDHFIGLSYLYGAILRKEVFDSKVPFTNENFGHILQRTDERVNTIRVHATERTIADIKNQPLFSKLGVMWVPLNSVETVANDGNLTHFDLEHGAECVGYRVEWSGHSLAYVTDTIAKRDAPYVRSIRGVKLLLHDCYLRDSQSKAAELIQHSHTTAVAEVAAEAEVGRLVLIHHNTVGMRVGGAELERARRIFPATQVGLDGMEIEF